MENATQLTPLEVTDPDSSVVTDSSYYDNEPGISYQTLGKRLNSLSMVIYIIVLVLGVFGNGLVIFITGFRMKKTVNTVWFLNLAIADFTFTFFPLLIIAYLALSSPWVFNGFMFYFGSINPYASIYFLTVISLDRCILVLSPVWAQNHRSPRGASFVALGVWILALALNSLNFHFRRMVWNGTVIHCYSNYIHEEQWAGVIYHAMITSRFIFAFVIPFLAIVLCYGAIVLRLSRARLARSSKPFKVITAVILAFFVCWLPYHVFSFLEIQAHEDFTLCLVFLIGSPLASSLAFINSCLNPILYIFMGRDFKEWLKRPVLAVFENTFAEEVRQSTELTQAKSSVELGSQNL